MASETDLAWRGECCIDSVSERKAELAQVLAAGGDVRLDLLEVSRIDTAGLQLLAAFVLEIGRRGHKVHWRGVSANVAEAARIAGLGGVLGLGSRSES